MKNFAGVSLPIAVALIVANLPGQAIGFAYGLMASVVAEYVEPTFVGILGGLVNLTTALLGILISSYIMGGVVSFTLKVARGQPVVFGDVFSGGKYFSRMLVGYIGLGIVCMIGFVLCIVPGVILAIGLSLWSNIIVDEGLPGIDALKKSWEMTKGHKVNLFVFGLLSGLAFIAGALACGVGALLVSAPMVLVATSYIYLKLKGEAPRLT
jgi:uncharacterized membrane protein